MAHADQPPRSSGTATVSGNVVLSSLATPAVWSIDLGKVSVINVHWKGETISITPDEIAEALRHA